MKSCGLLETPDDRQSGKKIRGASYPATRPLSLIYGTAIYGTAISPVGEVEVVQIYGVVLLLVISVHLVIDRDPVP